MESQLQSLSKIFTERIFRVPDYQRGYAWEQKHISDFWNDIEQLGEGNHYVGVLTLEEVPKENYEKWEDDLWIIESKNFKPYYVVDGQQRLTTTVIFIQSIIDVMEEDLNYTSKEEIQNKFIYQTKKHISKSYMFGYEKDNPSYDFLKSKIFHEALDDHSKIQETVYTHNLLTAKDFFRKKLKEKKLKEIEKIYTKITQKFLFNIYSISKDIDVYVAFESMNNRGKKLSHLELLKNRLIYLSTKIDVDKNEKNKLRNSINNCWKAIYHNLGREKNNPLEDDKFLNIHCFMYYGNKFLTQDESITRKFYRFYVFNMSSYLLDEVFTPKRLFNSEKQEKILCLNEIHNYVKSLQLNVEIWFKILNPFSSGYDEELVIWLEKINRLGNHTFFPLIMVFFRKEKGLDNRLKFLKILEKYGFLLELKNYNNFFGFDEKSALELGIKMINNKIKPSQVTNNIKSKFEEVIKNEETMSRIKNWLSSKGYYQWSGIKYFLYEYEEALKKKTKNYTTKLEWRIYNESHKDCQTVEHIYPRKSRKKYWINHYKKFTKKEKDALKDSLGNLLPLSRPKNSSLQDKPFPEKIDNKKNVGYRFGCYSEIEIADKKDWTAKEIIDRGLKLIDFISDRWGINLGHSEKEKIQVLGLKSVQKKINENSKNQAEFF